ncbi:unnamed protein product [Soboliphyme baturini]|uniref:MARVEL domain-containing protein n=1 Tax=Soboliphyme baturini TaxID=241478 RepID=A0A183IYN0_9BILA|nr:unnamed protein product [Soboliphyme baturini]
MGELQLRYSYCFSSVQGLLKLLQIVSSSGVRAEYHSNKRHTSDMSVERFHVQIFSSVILGLLLWETVIRTDRAYYAYRYLYEGEQYTVFVASFALCVISLFLILFFFNCHQGPLAACRCFNLAQFTYFLLFLMWIAAAGVEVWVTTRFKGYYGEQSELYGRRAAAAVNY